MDLAELKALQEALTKELNARNFELICQELSKNAKEFPDIVANIMKGLPASMQRQIETSNCFSGMKNLIAEVEKEPEQIVSDGILDQLFEEMKALEEQKAPDEVWVLKRQEIERALWAQYHATEKRAESMGLKPADWYGIHGEFCTNMDLAKIPLYNPKYYLKEAQQTVKKFDQSLNAMEQERQMQSVHEQQSKSAFEIKEYEAIISDTDEMFRLMNQYITLLVQASQLAPSKVKVEPEILSSYAKGKSLMEQIVRKGGSEITGDEATSFLYVVLLERNAYWPEDIGMPKNRFYTLIREIQMNLFRRLGNNSFRPATGFRSTKAQECKIKLQKAAAELQEIENEVTRLAKARIIGIGKVTQELDLNQPASSSSIFSGKPQQHSPYF